MPVSGGLSLGLTIAGVGTGLAAGGMTTGSDIYKKKKHRQGMILFPISCSGFSTDTNWKLPDFIPTRVKKDYIKARLEQMDQRDQILMIVSNKSRDR